MTAITSKEYLQNGLDEFWTRNIAQAELAKAADLKTRLFELKRRAKE